MGTTSALWVFLCSKADLYDARRFQRTAGGNCEPIDGQRLLAGPERYWQAYARRQPAEGTPVAAVIGVVADTKMPRDVPSIDQWYTPMDQPATLYGSGTPGNLSGPPSGYITMRSALDPQYMIQTLRSTIAEIDPLLALQEVRPLRMRFLQLRHRDISTQT